MCRYILIAVTLFFNLYPILLRSSNRQCIEYTFSDSVNRSFNDKMEKITEDPYVDWSFYKDFSKEVILRILPKKVIKKIQRMRDKQSPKALILHNVPIDQFVPETPRDGKRSKNKSYVSEALLLGFCGLLDCDPCATLANARMLSKDPGLKDSPLCIHQIIPLDDEQSKLTHSSSGSAVFFGPHTEAPQCEEPINFFLLYCLRGDSQVATSLIFVDDLLSFIKKHLPLNLSYKKFLAELKKSQFIMRNSSDIKTAFFEVILPILIEKNGRKVFRFDSNGVRIEGLNRQAKVVVDHIKKVLQDEAFKAKYVRKFYLKAGDLLIFNNREILHGRDSFVIDVNSWRWLQRVYCS